MCYFCSIRVFGNTVQYDGAYKEVVSVVRFRRTCYILPVESGVQFVLVKCRMIVYMYANHQYYDSGGCRNEVDEVRDASVGKIPLISI